MVTVFSKLRKLSGPRFYGGVAEEAHSLIASLQTLGAPQRASSGLSGIGAIGLITHTSSQIPQQNNKPTTTQLHYLQKINAQNHESHQLLADISSAFSMSNKDLLRFLSKPAKSVVLPPPDLDARDALGSVCILRLLLASKADSRDTLGLDNIHYYHQISNQKSNTLA